MEQSNNVLPEPQGEKQSAVVYAFERKPESLLLTKVRQNFGLFGGISLIFGVAFTTLFYKAGIGINTLIFTILTVILLSIIMKKLAVSIKTGTVFYYLGAILLAFSSVMTSSGILIFLNIIGIFFLLDLSLLHQFYEDNHWDFMKHMFHMFELALLSLISIGMPFIDCINLMKRSKLLKHDKSRNIFLGILISVPFLWVVTALLAKADLLFGKLTNGLFHVVFSADIITIVLLTLFGFMVCYCVICGAVMHVGIQEKKAWMKADTSIAVTFMTILGLVYALFCGIQIVYLFAKGLFILPQEFTYAEYARRGFFQLLAVVIMNVALILICKALFRESKWLRLINTCVTLFTYIMIASATYRMLLYIGVYHLTFLRVFVLLSLLIITLILAGVIITEYKPKFPLFRYCVVVVSTCYIVFSLSKPDYYIADYLIQQTDLLDQGDIYFLTSELSLDAAPLVLSLLDDTSRWTLLDVSEDKLDRNEYDMNLQDPQYYVTDYYRTIIVQSDNREFRDFNYSIYQAEKSRLKYHPAS